MKDFKKKSYLVALLLVVVLLLASCGSGGAGDSGSASTESSNSETDSSGGDSGASVGTDFDGSRTLLIYMVGSDLEPSTAAASNDLTEIEESGVNLDKVNVLVFTGGAPTWHSEIPTDKNALLELTSEGFKVKETFDVKSMGDSENLARFLNYSCENYSSGEYDLILWDHGCGPIMGYGIDKQFENDTLTLPELKEALSNSPFGKDKKLGFIGCDACLMASAELASVVSDYAEILVSSQEAEPSFGWNYAFMSEADSLNALDFSKSIVDKYMEYSEEFFSNNKFFQSDVTLSVVNLNEAKNIEDAINTLFADAIDDVSGAYNKLAVSRVESRDLGRASTGSDYDLVDLQSLLDCMSARYPKETEAALDALNKAVLYNKTNTPECSGLSLYYPFYNKIYFENSWEQGYKDLGVFADYFTYMQRFSKVWLGTDGREVFKTAMIAEQGDEELTYTVKLTPEQVEAYANGGYYILRNTEGDVYEAVMYSDDVTLEGNTLNAVFNGKAIYAVVEDLDEYYIPQATFKGRVGDELLYIITGSSVDAPGKEFESVEIHMAVNARTGELTYKGMYILSNLFGDIEASEERKAELELYTGKKEPLYLQEWEKLTMLAVFGKYLTRGEDGIIRDFWEWDQWGGITGVVLPTDKVEFKYEPIHDDGNQYYLMFSVGDTHGDKWSSELLPISLTERPESSIETKTLEWDGLSDLILYEEEGHVLSLCASLDQEKTVFSVKAVNNNVEQYTYSLDNYVCNKELFMEGIPGTYTHLSESVGEETTSDMETLNKLVGFSGLDSLNELDLDLSITSQNTELLFQPVKIIINNGKGMLIKNKESSYLQFRGYNVKDIPLWEDGDLKCVLVSVGSDASAGGMHLMFCVSNKGDNSRTFRYGGASVNGLNIPDFLSAIHIPPGMNCYYEASINSDDFDKLGLRWIDTLKVETLTRDEGPERIIWSSLKDDASYVDSFNPGETVFDKNGIRIGVLDYWIDNNYRGYTYTWDISIENQSDSDAIISTNSDYLPTIDGQELPDTTYFYFGQMIAAGEKTYATITLDDTWDNPLPITADSEMAFHVEISNRDYTKLIYKSEEPVVLTAKRYDIEAK